MAKQLGPSAVAAILTAGTFDDLKGALEDEHLECKAAPYQLQHDHQKYELAKDVSMIVNRSARSGNEGGHILLGVKTEKSAEYHADVIVDVSPFAQGLVDPKQYYDVLKTWLHPMPEGIDIRWHKSASDDTRGIVAISIPRQPPDRWPCVVTKILDASAKVSGVSIAYVERRGEHGVEWTPADLQRLLRDGARATDRDALTQQVEALSVQVQAIQDHLAKGPATPPPGPSQAVQFYPDRRGQAVIAAGLRGKPVYALTAAPVEAVSLPTLFRGPNDPLVQLLAKPPSLRYAGFGLDVSADLAIVQGQLRRAVAPGHALLECWADGTLIYVVEATNFLCWGDKTTGTTLYVNPLALAESTYLFTTLAHRIYTEHATPRPKAAQFGLTLERMNAGGKVAAVLAPYGVKSNAYRFGFDAKQAPGSGAKFVVSAEGPWTPGRTAYRLTAAVYTWFGHTEVAVPYAVEENGDRAISEKLILEDGKN
jgi:hypothetical protein